MWRLFARDLKSLCEGKEGCLLIKHNAEKLQQGVFRSIGMLIGVSLAQGGSGFPFFAPSTFSYICCQDVCSVVVGRDEIPFPSIDEMLEKITSAGTDNNKVRDAAMDAIDVLESCGFRKPIATLTHNDVPLLIECVALHTSLYQRKAELDEIIKGLQVAGVLDMIRTYPDLFRPLFVKTTTSLTAESVMALFENKVFSEAGTNQLKMEQATYMLFQDLLEELEDPGVAMDVGVCAPALTYTEDDNTDHELLTISDMTTGTAVTDGGNMLGLEECLVLFTGANQVPAAGFDTSCTLNFSATNVYLTASTCALVLTLPTRYHDNYVAFRKNMLFAFFNNGGFGLC